MALQLAPTWAYPYMAYPTITSVVLVAARRMRYMGEALKQARRTFFALAQGSESGDAKARVRSRGFVKVQPRVARARMARRLPDKVLVVVPEDRAAQAAGLPFFRLEMACGNQIAFHKVCRSIATGQGQGRD